MKCFYYFKDYKSRSRTREQRSAPELKDPTTGRGDYSGAEPERVTKSSCSATSSRSIPDLYEEKAHNLQVFSLSELRQATNDFSRLCKIGEGGFGSVYKGLVKPANARGHPTVVAIKKLNREGFQGHKQWLAEVQFLGVVEHPNLVKLIGYCAVDGERGIQRLLVYEYMQNRSLEDHLFGRALPVLTWETRLNIILGAAQGLAYLHEELEVQVIFRDFKSSNVLLDEDFKPKLSDFGLAREGPTAGRTHVSTAQFPADGRKFTMIIDPRLGNNYLVNAARKIAKLADKCLLKNAKDRPKMSEVVEKLKQIIQVTDERSPCERSFESSGSEHFESSESEQFDESRQDQIKASESAKRRMDHLASLSEHVEGVGGRRFMILQRAK
ncbi:Serine-threonine/tyrosine-protein kinase, catalytic domain, partial [Dillenia turbinata]